MSRNKCQTPVDRTGVTVHSTVLADYSIALNSASGVIGFRRELPEQLEERGRLTDEEAHRRQELHSPYRGAVRFGGSNNRAWRQAPTEKRTGLRHDQVSLKGLSSERRGVEVWKDQSICRIGQGRRIAGFVGPSLKVHGFGGADAEQYA